MKLGLSFALIVVVLGVVACSEDEVAPTPIVDAGPPDARDICSSFTRHGGTCSLVSSRVCFPMCSRGGCRCVDSPAGAVWACASDFSCYPDSGPDLDATLPPPPPPEDASPEDASIDASSDATADGSSDARADGANDASDAASDAGDAGSADASDSG